ncbi:hypothetical protein CO174_03945 [Candidatus Uhrbacteria bacterium CG_4_9_14_3_um_filter_50_9]|uniref:Glycosyl transferase family 1 domain-containing protein n=1 Tax=Candidatus Uhrbacteria bacterium CG_4_9_14_3_um_filter_50_9 TaxID=1975035 RepID=A0A2M7XBN4_9BACT|nr:MAG: hypothetical protein CO174_03945 [Candidatus Uhrbacteria bacterium CG_4_9_14_3_um_filter_50_9]
MTLHILYNFRDEPWGGGNQFLKALRAEWREQGCYAESAEEADVVFFNSYPFRAEHFFLDLYRLKKSFPNKRIVYRLNGPISYIRNQDKTIDRIIKWFNSLLADGIIFQSNWCKERNNTLFGITSKNETVIHNAPDDSVFFSESEKQLHTPVRLIATSWSNNRRKGFDVYQYLDEHLDFSRYQMTFVGNSPISFNNIHVIEAVSSEKLAAILKDHDIFITASQTDPCSNALIEALNSGLPAVTLNDGGHPELVQHGGELFTSTHDVIAAIDRVRDAYQMYRSTLPTFSIKDTADAYKIFAEQLQGEPKQVNLNTRLSFLLMMTYVFLWKTLRKPRALWKHLWTT